MNDEVSDLTSRCNSRLWDLKHGTDTISVESWMCFVFFRYANVPLEACNYDSVFGMPIQFLDSSMDGFSCFDKLFHVGVREVSSMCRLLLSSPFTALLSQQWICHRRQIEEVQMSEIHMPRQFCMFFWRWNPNLGKPSLFATTAKGRHRVSMRIIRARQLGGDHDVLDTLMEVRSGPSDCEWVVSELLVSCWRWKRMQPAI